MANKYLDKLYFYTTFLYLYFYIKKYLYSRKEHVVFTDYAVNCKQPYICYYWNSDAWIDWTSKVKKVKKKKKND